MSQAMMTPRRRYSASRGGHAPGHLREAFCDWADEWESGGPELSAHEEAALVAGEPLRMPETAPLDEKRVAITWLFGQLWNCRDQMPSQLRDMLVDLAGDELSAADTYAAAVRRLSAIRENR